MRPDNDDKHRPHKDLKADSSEAASLFAETARGAFAGCLSRSLRRWEGLFDFEEYRQRVLARACMCLGQFAGTTPAEWGAWLMRIGRTVARNELCRRECQEASEQAWTEHQAHRAADDLAATERFEALLAGLAPADALLLRLRYAENCSFREIAEELGIREATARQRHRRILKKLRG